MKRIKTKTHERLMELAGYATELASLLRDLRDDAETYYDDRTERWQESDRGEAYSQWRDAIVRAAREADSCACSAEAITQSPEE